MFSSLIPDGIISLAAPLGTGYTLLGSGLLGLMCASAVMIGWAALHHYWQNSRPAVCKRATDQTTPCCPEYQQAA